MSDDADDDLALWHQARAGNPEARQAIAEAARRMARSQSMRFHSDTDEAEEIESRLMQMVFEQIASGRSVPRSSLSGWLRAWYWSVRKDHIRQRAKHRPVRGAVSAHDDLVDPRPADLGTAELEELRSAIQHCLEKLPEAQRRAVLVRYADGFSIAQSELKLREANPNTIRVWAFRGATALRACLEAKGVA